MTSSFARPSKPYGLFAQKRRGPNEAISPASPPPPATGATLRWPMLLSNGTSRQCGVGPVAQGRPEAASALLRSPVAETLMSMHSCPISEGVHWNGPTNIVVPGAMGPGNGIEAVVIACQSSGHDSPADGLQ